MPGYLDRIDPWASGLRLDPQSLPQAVDWPFPDIHDFGPQGDVSPRLRDAIEAMEPNVHQFEPVVFVASDGREIERFWWQICRSLDSIDKTDSSVELINIKARSGRVFRSYHAKHRGPEFLVFRKDVIGACCFWQEKYLVQKSHFCSELARATLMASDITGLSFYGYHSDDDCY